MWQFHVICNDIGHSLNDLPWIFVQINMWTVSGRFNGRAPGTLALLPRGSRFFHFYAVFGRKNRLAYPLRELAPPPPPEKILDPILTVSKTYCRQDLVCHNNKDGRVQRILGNSYGQPIIGDRWKSVAPYHFCNRDHKHPEYGRVLTGDSNGEFTD